MKTMKLLSTLLLLFAINSFSFGQGFVTTWVTTDNTIKITTGGTNINYNITWTNLTNTGVGDGSASNVTVDYTITGLANNDTYQVEITGSFPRIRFSNTVTADNQKIRTIEQWGNIAWESMADAFYGCTNLVYNAIDTPNLSNVTNMTQMFASCPNFNGNINDWNVSNVTNMDRLFINCWAFNQPLNGWDVSNVTTMSSTFSGAKIFNQPLDNWDVSNVNNFKFMFINTDSFNQSLNMWDMSAATDISHMFDKAKGFNQPLDNWNVDSVTTMALMFRQAESFDQSLDDWNISNVTDIQGMFSFSGMGIESYDSTLIGWAAQTVQPNVSLGATGLSYCLGENARTTLTTAPNNWTISGDSKDCSTISITNIPANEDMGLRVWPNPASDHIQLNIGAIWQNELLSLTITSMEGKLLSQFQGTIEQLESPLNAVYSDLANGLYLLNVKNENSSQSIKLVKIAR